VFDTTDTCCESRFTPPHYWHQLERNSQAIVREPNDIVHIMFVLSPCFVLPPYHLSLIKASGFCSHLQIRFFMYTWILSMNPGISAARSPEFPNIAPASSATSLQEGLSFGSSGVVLPRNRAESMFWLQHQESKYLRHSSRCHCPVPPLSDGLLH